MTVEKEIINAMNTALDRGWDPRYAGILQQALNEQLHELNLQKAPLGNVRRKELRQAVRLVRRGYLPPYKLVSYQVESM